MSKQKLIDFIEKVAQDPKYKNEADWVLLQDRKGVSSLKDPQIWHVIDELRSIALDLDEGFVPGRHDAVEIIRIVRLYED